MRLTPLSPVEAQRLLQRGALLVDIREAAEHRRGRIPGAHHAPLSELRVGQVPDLDPDRSLVFHCRSGARTAAHAEALAALSGREAYVLAGGIEAWRSAGLPVASQQRTPISLERQVRLSAGALVLLGLGMSYTVSPGFLLLPALVGAGLLQAGVTGWCGLALLLGAMPWNRQAPAGPQPTL